MDEMNIKEEKLNYSDGKRGKHNCLYETGN
jgi:hypothetical protein